MSRLFYPGCEGLYDIQLYDHVEAELDHGTFQGMITKIMPRRRAVRIAYDDFVDCRRDGEPIRRAATVPIADCCLIARDG